MRSVNAVFYSIHSKNDGPRLGSCYYFEIGYFLFFGSHLPPELIINHFWWKPFAESPQFIFIIANLSRMALNDEKFLRLGQLGICYLRARHCRKPKTTKNAVLIFSPPCQRHLPSWNLRWGKHGGLTFGTNAWFIDFRSHVRLLLAELIQDLSPPFEELINKEVPPYRYHLVGGHEWWNGWL